MDINLAFICVIVFAFSYFGTKYMIIIMPKLKIIAIPEARSNHTIHVPVGGGIAILGATFIGLYLLSLRISVEPIIIKIIFLSLPLLVISFIDDIKTVPIFIRIIIQSIISIYAVCQLPHNQLIFNGLLPYILDRIMGSVLLIWFINCYNFMDGIDGMSACETIHIAFAILILASLTGILGYSITYFSLIIIIATLGFLFWNWHQAKIFMGDVGSITLGFILGYLLLYIASKGFYLAALIIPLYYLLDSGITVTKRFIKGKNIFHAHSEHYYQQAVRRGLSHDQVVKKVIFVNLLLLLLMIINIYGYIYFSAIISVIIIVLFLKYFI